MSYGQQPYGNPPYGQNPYGQNPYGQNPYGQNPYGQPQAQPQAYPQPYQPQPAYGQPAPQQPTPRQPAPQPQGYPQQASASPTPPPLPSLQTPVPAPAPRRVPFATHGLLCVTTDLIPGREIATALGEVIGVVVRPRLTGTDRAALLVEQRQEAVDAAVAMAVGAEADAVVGLRFESSLLDSGSEAEIVAYGTAVKLVPLVADAVVHDTRSAGSADSALSE